MEKGILNIGKCFRRMLFVSPFTTFDFDIRNVIFFEIKVFSRNIKKTTLERGFIKVTSFTRLRVIRRINRVY